jgi:Zn-dependent M28 family amino/carboxypeptidase
MGLQGSTYFVDHVPAQFTKVDAMFNFDMTGEGEGTNSSCSADPAELKETLEKADTYVHTLRRVGVMRGAGVRGSDYAPFYNKGISVISFSSNGPHLHYHLPGDTIYRINPEIMADMARLAFIAGFNWADR